MIGPGLRTREEILFASVLATGCGWPSAQERFPVPAETLRILRTVPADGERDVAPDVTVDVCFSHPVDPRSVDDFDALIASGPLLFDTQLQLQLVPWRGPGGTAPGANPWCPGSVLTVTPLGPLQEGILHRLQMRPAAGGWGGEQLQTEGDGWTLNEAGEPRFFVEFTIAQNTLGGSTGGTGDSTGSEPVGVQLADLFEDGRVFDPAANHCRCHRDGAPPEHPVAQERVDLATPSTTYRDLVEVQGLRETGFPMIAARNPSESYLVHKLLKGRDGGPLHGVLGDAMPLDGELPYPVLVDLVRWIEDGAKP